MHCATRRRHDYDGNSRICENLRSFGIRIVLISVFFVAVYIPYFADVVAFIGAFLQLLRFASFPVCCLSPNI